MNVKLVVVDGDARTKEVTLRLPAVIGRGHGSSLRIPQALVSRQHCEVFESEDGRLRVRDLGSLNGTFLDGATINEEVLLPGHTLTIGSVTFRVEYDVSEAAALNPPNGFLPKESPSVSTTPTQRLAIPPAVESGPNPFSATPEDQVELADHPTNSPAPHDLAPESVDTTNVPESTSQVAAPLAIPVALPVSPMLPPLATPEDKSSDDDDELRAFLESLGK